MFKNRKPRPRHTLTVESFPPGKEVTNPAPGDFILTHGKSWTSRMIRFGQRIRYWGPDRIYTRWNHAAIFVADTGDIVEALGGGVQRRNISVYKETEYHVVRLQNVTGARTGEIFPQDPWRIMPADLAKYFDVKPADAKAPTGNVPRRDTDVKERSK